MKPSFLLSAAIIAIFFISPVNAQFKCGADEVRAKLIAGDPTYLKSLEKINASINSYIKAHLEAKRALNGELDKILPRAA